MLVDLFALQSSLNFETRLIIIHYIFKKIDYSPKSIPYKASLINQTACIRTVQRVLTRINVAQVDLLEVQTRHLGEKVGEDGEDEGVGPEDEAVAADEPDVEQAAVEVRFPHSVGEKAAIETVKSGQ